MTKPLTALTGLYGPGTDARSTKGRLESQGGPVGPGFGVRDPQVPLAYWAGPTPNTEQVFNSPLQSAPPTTGGHIEGPGSLIDTTPAESGSHAAPYPRQMGYGNLHSADEQIAEQEARRTIKGVSLGGPEKVRTDPQGFVQPETWDAQLWVGTGETVLSDAPDQIKSSPLGGSGNGKNRIGSRQSFGVLGGYGSGAAHVQRRNGIDPVPGNRQWLNSAERPIMAPRRGYQASFDGQDSPYGALGDTSQDMQQGTDNAAVMSLPTPYNDPPNPATNADYLAPGTPGITEAPMISDFF